MLTIALPPSRPALSLPLPALPAGDYDPANPPKSGLSVARQIAMFSYRSHPAYSGKFGRTEIPAAKRDSAWVDAAQGQETSYEVERYLRYQGAKFCSRFDALSFVKLTRTMDSHDVGRGRRGGVRGVLGRMGAAFARDGGGVLVIGVSSDGLYPVSEQHELVEMLNSTAQGKNAAAYFEVESDSGHDGFLLDSAVFSPALRAHLTRAYAQQQLSARL